MTIVIVKISIPEVKIAVLKNLLIFGEKYLPQSVRLLEGGGVETLFGRIPFEHRFFLHGSSLSDLKSGKLTFHGAGKPKVCNLDCHVFSEQHVTQLEVSVEMELD